MFERFLRFVEVRRAIERGRLEHAFELLDDGEIRDHRKAAQLRDLCVERLCARADGRLALGELDLVRADLDLLARRCPEHPDLGRRRAELAEREAARRTESGNQSDLLRQARSAIDAGELEVAAGRLASLATVSSVASERTGLERLLEARQEEA